MEINQQVTACITHLEEYGLYAEAVGQQILIVAGHASWVPIVLHERFSVGDEVKVLLLRFVPELNLFLGSLRALQENPYQALVKLPPQEIFTAKVVRLADYRVYLQLPNSVWGELPRDTIKGTVHIGDELQVTITWIHLKELRVRLQLAQNPSADRVVYGSDEQAGQRKLLSPAMEKSMALRFPTSMSPEEYAARESHTIMCFGLHELRFRDEKLDQWIQRLGEIFSTPGLRDYYRRQLLTPEEYQRILVEEAQVH